MGFSWGCVAGVDIFRGSGKDSACVDMLSWLLRNDLNRGIVGSHAQSPAPRCCLRRLPSSSTILGGVGQRHKRSPPCKT